MTTQQARPYEPPKAPAKGRLPEARWTGTESQPVSRILWVPRSQLRANDWNPNRTARPEMHLLALSLLEDGWTQPIVVRDDGETIVDGFHRWTVGGWPALAGMTDDMVPVAVLNETPEAQQRMATVRHNRARGSHYVLAMAEIVGELLEEVGPEEIGRRLGMEPEEVARLAERGNMLARGSSEEGFGKGWVPE